MVAGGVYAALNHFVSPPGVEAQVQVVRHIQNGGPMANGDESYDNEPYDTLDFTDTGLLSVLPQQVVQIMDRKEQFFTFLIFGLDHADLTDVIMLGAFDGKTRTGTVINIPRDTRVEAGRRLNKVNSAYPVGRLNGGGHEGGVAMLKQDMQLLFGFKPDFYVGIDYEAFVRMVDAVGGVEVEVPFHMQNTRPDSGVYIDIPAGLQLLDGEQALNFARFRNANQGFRAITDFDRIKNHQKIVYALFEELISPGTIALVPEFIRIYQDYVSTNLTTGELLWFAEQLSGIHGTTALASYTFPIARTQREGWYEIPCIDGVTELINRTVNPFIQDITADMLRIVS